MKTVSFTSEHLRTVAALLESGLSTLDTFLYIRDSFFAKKTKSFISIIDLIHSGADFKTLFAQTNVGSTPLYIHLIESSQTNGTVPDGLRDICAHMDSIQERKRVLLQILIYPCIVSLVLLILLFSVLVFVLPQLKPIMSMSGEDIPMITKMLIYLSDILIKSPILSVVTLIGFGGVFLSLILHPKLRLVLYRAGTYIPFISTLLQHSMHSQIAVLVFYHLKSGSSMAGSWSSIFSLPTLTSSMSKTVRSISIDIDRGGKLSQVLQRYHSIPIIWILYTHLGETKMGYQKAFEYIAKVHEETGARYMAYIQKSIEPILMIIIGLIVGIFAYAIVLPIYGLVQTLQS